MASRGSPSLQSGGGGKSEVAHLWAKRLRHPCRLGDPHHFKAGGKIRSGPLVGKMATSPLPSRGSPPLQSGGGGGIKSGPLMGKEATSPLPSRGSPPLQSGGRNQKWPTCGQRGFVTHGVSGIPTASERGAKSEVAHLWAQWLRHPCRLGDPHRCRAGRGGGGNQKWPTCRQRGYVTPAVSGIPTAAERGGGGNQKWPTCGQRGFVTHGVSGIPIAAERGGGGDQKWPTCGQSGCVTPAVSGMPTTSKRGAKSEVAHLWAKWLRHPCRLGDPHRCRAGGGGGESKVAHLWAKRLRHPCPLGDPNRCRAGGGIRSGPLVGKVAVSPMASRGSPPPQSGGQNQKWPTCGQSGYVTPAISGIPTAAERGGNQKWPTCGQSGYVTPAVSGIPSAAERGGGGDQKWPTYGQRGYVTPALSGIPTAAERGQKSEVAHLWAKRLCHPWRLGDPHRLRAGGKIRSGPLVGKVATSPLPPRGSPPLQSGAQNQKWPTCGQSGYVTLAISGIPTAAERGGKSEVAHLWAKWLRHPCRLGDPHRFTAGGIRSGPLVGKVATSPLPSRGSPPLQSGGGNQKWPTCGQSGYVTPAVSGIPTAAERGGKSEVAHLWAKWLCHPWRLGDPHHFKAGGEIRSGPLVGKVATSPLPSRGSPPLRSGGGRGGIRSGPLVSRWLCHPCRLGDPHRFRAGGGGGVIISPFVGKVATSALPSRGSPPLQSGGGNQKWPTCGQSGYVTPAVSGIPTASERGAKSEVAHLWAKWLRHPCHLGDPHRCTAGGEIRSGPLVGKVATSPLPSRGSPPLQSGGGNQKWPTCGQSGYVTPAASGIPTAAERGAKSDLAQKWAKWLRHPCRLGDPHRCKAGGGGISSCPLVGKVAVSPLPSRGSPPLQSGGQNQKWPTCGQSGYVTPAASGILTAAERGAKSEVAQKWAKWLRHPCRLGDPLRFRAGGKITSSPLVGKVATSPLPSRGSPPLQSGGGGGDQKWPTCGQSGYVTPAVWGIPTAAERGARSM